MADHPELLLGYGTKDDAAVWQLREDLACIQTVDFFPPIVDDPFRFGQIAAANALSDIYAMGGEPKLCLNISCFPDELTVEEQREILRGGFSKVQEAGAALAGGHTIRSPEPVFGMSVTSFMHPKDIFRNGGVRVGDVLFYTKPLGIGIVTTAGKRGKVDPETLDACEQAMMQLNREARDVMIAHGATAATDVTGFGFLGHLTEMAEASGVSLVITTRTVPLLPGVLDLSRAAVFPGGLLHNQDAFSKNVEKGDIEDALERIFYDPQTSGGMLFSVPADQADACEAELEKRFGKNAARVGHAIEAEGHLPIILD